MKVVALGALLAFGPGALANSIVSGPCGYSGQPAACASPVASSISCTTTVSETTTPSISSYTTNLVVPKNATCIIAPNASGPGVSLTGNVTVCSGATLQLYGTTSIGGNLTACGCVSVALNPYGIDETTIAGNAEILNCTGSAGIVGTLDTETEAAFASEGLTSTIGKTFLCQGNTEPCYFGPYNAGE